MTLCTCGHDHYSHASGGACMYGNCGCLRLDEAETRPGTADQAARRLYGDETYERQQARSDELWEQQRRQMIATTSRLFADADIRDAQARLLELAWWAIVTAGPAVLALIAWVVVA